MQPVNRSNRCASGLSFAVYVEAQIARICMVQVASIIVWLVVPHAEVFGRELHSQTVCSALGIIAISLSLALSGRRRLDGANGCNVAEYL